MKKSEIIQKVQQGAESFQALFEGLGPEAMLEPGVVENWSLKDLIAHVSFWKADLITVLFNAQVGTTPPGLGRPRDIDAMNAKFYQESQGRTTDQVLADYLGVTRQLVRRITELPEDLLHQPGKFSWDRKMALEDWIASNSYEHEEEHAAEITAWRKKRQGAGG